MVICVYVLSCSVLSAPLGPHDLSPISLLCLWFFQARVLEWVAISFFRGSSWPRDWTCVSCIGRWILHHCTTWEAQVWVAIRRVNSYTWVPNVFCCQDSLKWRFPKFLTCGTVSLTDLEISFPELLSHQQRSHCVVWFPVPQVIWNQLHLIRLKNCKNLWDVYRSKWSIRLEKNE